MLAWPACALQSQAAPELHLIKGNDNLRTTIVVLKRQLEDRDGHVGRLHILMRERIERIDELNDRIAQLRDQNRRLDEENDRLVEMMQLHPEASLQA